MPSTGSASKGIAPARRARLGAWAFVFGLSAIVASGQTRDEADDRAKLCTDASIAHGWRVLRVVDCARCHGRDYTGLAAPSIVTYVANQSRESFNRMVIEGDSIRGMPGYRDNAYVAESLDDIYRYFRARANGEIGPDYRPLASVEAGESACSVGLVERARR